MYFTTIVLAALSLTNYVSCLPNSLKERQTVTVSPVVNLQLNIGDVINKVTDELAQITQLVKSTGSTTDPTTQIKLAGELNSIGKSIETQLIAAVPAIQAITSKLPSSPLSSTDLSTLTLLVNSLKTFSTAVLSTLSATQSQVSSSTASLFAAESKAVSVALKSFLTPVLTFAGSVATNSGGAAAGSTDLLSTLTTAVQALLSGANSVLSSVGIQIPALPGLPNLL